MFVFTVSPQKYRPLPGNGQIIPYYYYGTRKTELRLARAAAGFGDGHLGQGKTPLWHCSKTWATCRKWGQAGADVAFPIARQRRFGRNFDAADEVLAKALLAVQRTRPGVIMATTKSSTV
jgi:hypothetical protein